MTDKRRDDGEVERKLEAFFRAETDDLAPTEDLWAKVSGRLGKQENPRWYLRRPSFRSYATRRIIAAVILLLAVLTLAFFLFRLPPPAAWGHLPYAVEPRGEGTSVPSPESSTRDPTR